VGDNLRPLTLLLGATCLWALCVLVLALAGLGARFAPPSETARAPALPKITLSRSQSRLGPITDYLEVGQRPLLTSDRRPGAQPADGSEGTAELDVALTSVLITPRLQLAIFTDNKDASSRRVRVGEVVPGSNWRLVSLEPRRAVMEGPSGQRDLPLRVFDGKGGQPPTPMAMRPASEVRPDTVPPADARPSLPPPPPPDSPKPQPAEQASRDNPAPDQNPAAPLSQEQQVEAIRRRIEARRAQMRAEAAAAGAQEK
jgi:general secretion pathway protein N